REPDVLPRTREARHRHEYPLDLVARLGQADLLRGGVPVDGLPEISRVAAGLAMMELSRRDGSIATRTGVQGGLAMRSIQLCG
ncbi:acyl-CoA dehydrogenase family protein, partial [Micrococcus sp. SIMBA_131]